MCYRVEQFTIHLQHASGREARRAWEHGQGFTSPKRYVVLTAQKCNTYAKQSPENGFRVGF